MANSSGYTSRHKADVKINKEINLRNHSEKIKEKGISKDEKVIGEKNKSFKLEIEPFKASFDPKNENRSGNQKFGRKQRRRNFDLD